MSCIHIHKYKNILYNNRVKKYTNIEKDRMIIYICIYAHISLLLLMNKPTTEVW